jgi:dTDP-4-amino-4,6-dideoxygalactose transaminase
LRTVEPDEMLTSSRNQGGATTGTPVRVRFLDLSVKDAAERAEILNAVAAVLDHGRIVLGPEVFEFERQVAALCHRRHGIGVGSGTDALIIGLKALGIGPGDEVITTPLSWLATGSAILLNGATPVFADVDETLNLDPETIEPLITAKTKAVLPVHFTGHLAPMPEIIAIARRHRLLVIEDGAQAFGATLNGVPCGAFGDMACISLNPMKLLGAIGDAGIILTDDPDMAKRVDMLRHTGVVDREYCKELSHNCRLDTLQAAVLLKRLARYPASIGRRREIAARYSRELAGIVATPPAMPGYEDAVYTYTIRTSRRDALRDYLADLGIETRIQHPLTMAEQPAFQGKYRGAAPRAARLVKEIICIPAHEKMSDADQDFVIDSIKSFFKRP